MQKVIAILFIFFSQLPFLLSQNWQSVGNGVSNQVRGLFADTIDNLLYVTGAFEFADTIPAYSIASWNGAEWKDLDSGSFCNCCGSPVFSAIRYKNEIYAGGMFFCMGGAPNTQGIARWNGTNWLTVGGGLIEGYCKFKIFNDELYVYGGFDSAGSMQFNSIAKWNGSQWSDVYNFPKDSFGGINFINDVAIYKGELYVAGHFEHQNDKNEIAKWNGAQWVSVGGGIKGDGWVNKMVVYNDELYVGGWFYRIDGNAGNFLMKWDGNNWLDVENNILCLGQVTDMQVNDNKLYVVGGFQYIPDTTWLVYNIGSFDGNEWCGIGKKTDPEKLDWVQQMEFYNNELYVGGTDTIGGQDVNYIAKWIGGNLEDTCVTVVGQNEISGNKPGITVFPNPTTNKIKISSNHNITSITIYNVFGQQIFQSANSNLPAGRQGLQSIMDLSSYPNGFYFLTATINGQLQSFKLIKID